MKKIISIVICLIFLLSSTSCNKRVKDDNDKIKLVASFYPVYIMALNIIDGVDKIELINMTDQHAGCLHDFKLTTEEMKNIERAKGIIINGASMEEFIDDIVSAMPNKTIIDSSEDINIMHEHNNHEQEHRHNDMNSHIWLSISNYIKQVKNISKGIISIDPLHIEQYQKNTDKYILYLETLKDKMHSELNNIENNDIITLHKSFDYLANEFNFNIIYTINHGHNEELSSKEIAETIEILNKSKKNVPIFVESKHPSASAQIISNETGNKIYTLDSAVTGEVALDAYIKIMEKNLEILKEALA